MKTIEVNLNDTSLFTINIGKRITKKELHNKTKGKYPIYSANIFKEFGWTNNLLTMDFTLEYVLWGIDGIWMTKYIPSKTFFVPTDHCGFLSCKDKNINLEYVAIKLFEIGLQYGFSRTYRASIDNIKNITIPIPINKKGYFDIEEQNQIAEKHKNIEKIKSILNSYLIMIKNSNIKNNDNNKLNKTIKLSDIIDFAKSKTNNSSFTKKFIFNNQGNIPVYGASQYSDIPSYGYVKDNLEGIKYFENCLTWNIDGSIGCFYRKGRFALSEKVIPLFLKTEYKNIIDLNYLSFKLVEKAQELGFSRFYKPNQIKLQEVELSFPINKEGNIDLEQQKKIALKYKNIEEQRKNLIDYLSRVEKTRITIN